MHCSLTSAANPSGFSACRRTRFLKERDLTIAMLEVEGMGSWLRRQDVQSVDRHGVATLTGRSGYSSLLRLVPSIRSGLIAAVAAGVAAGALLIVQMLLLSWIVRDVLFRGETLDDVAPLLILAAGVIAWRAALIALREVAAKRTA